MKKKKLKVVRPKKTVKGKAKTMMKKESMPPKMMFKPFGM
jgi:hypothetical protein